jgi:hypothetical protein
MLLLVLVLGACSAPPTPPAPTLTAVMFLGDASYGGYAFIDANENSQLDPDDPPLEGAVFLVNVNGAVIRALTDKTGFALVRFPFSQSFSVSLKMEPPEKSDYVVVGWNEVEGQCCTGQSKFLFARRPSTATPSPTRGATQTPRAPAKVQAPTIRASATSLRVGERVTITSTLPTGLGIPVYSVRAQDQGSAQAGVLITLTPTDEVRNSRDASRVLKLVSAKSKTGEVVAVLEARAPGQTEISVSVNGETGQIDEAGRAALYFVTKLSENVTIKVE